MAICLYFLGTEIQVIESLWIVLRWRNNPVVELWGVLIITSFDVHNLQRANVLNSSGIKYFHTAEVRFGDLPTFIPLE